MDLAEFAVIRPPRPPDPKRLTVLRDSFTVAPKQVATHLPKPITVTVDTLPEELGDPAADPLARYDDARDASVIARLHALVNTCSRLLADAGDRMSGRELQEQVTEAMQRERLVAADQPMEGEGDVWDDPSPALLFRIARLLLRQALLTALKPDQPDYPRAVRLTRLALVADLLAEDPADLDTMTPDDVFDRLHRRPLVLAGLSAVQVAPQPKIQLVRDATVRDLQVVRREWAGYLAGEVANVRNVMPGESLTQHEITQREDETTTTRETERREETETVSESKLSSEISQAVNSELAVSINGHVEGSAEYRYPTVTARIAGGVDAGLTMQRSEETSSKLAREAVARATSRVDSRTRQSRVDRELIRSEQGSVYSLRHDGPDSLHGVYRWVDRVDTYQLFRFTDRLQLEFQLPEPAEFYRWRRANLEREQAEVDKPPEWNLHQNEIIANELVNLAIRYRATDLPAPPDESVTVVRTLTVAPNAIDAGDERQLNAPTAASEIEIPIPDDYETNEVKYEGEGFPVNGKWKNAKGQDQDGLATAIATVAVGDTTETFWNSGLNFTDRKKNRFRWHATHGDNHDLGTATDVQMGPPPFGRALLPIGEGTEDLIPGAKTVGVNGAASVLKVAVATRGMAACVVTFSVTCKLKESARVAWRLRVYDGLYGAWAQWKRDYENQQTRRQLLGQGEAADAGSSERNDQIIREELKRLVIAWLLDDAAFRGRPALQDPPVEDAAKDFRNMNIEKAIADAPTIQFLEQAFEWSNMAYVFYPYYWADRARWETLSKITANDREFERFLRAGSARVIVPARPSFEDAVRNWLLTGTPFLSGRLPNPDEPLYVSIDTEIREMTSPHTDGIPQDWWQSRISTTMLYLDTADDLPITNAEHRLPAEAGVPYKPKPWIKFD